MQTHRITILLSATILLCALSARAEEPVNIPDPALKAAIEAQLGIPNPTPSDMLGLANLDASVRGITDLTGLEYAINLRTLNLTGNSITDVSELRPGRVRSTAILLSSPWLRTAKISDSSLPSSWSAK